MVKVLLSILVGFPVAVMAQVLDFGAVTKLSSSVNTADEEVYPLASSDGHSLYFARMLSEQNKGGKYSGADVWISRYDVTTVDWGKPRNTFEKINTSGHNVVV